MLLKLLARRSHQAHRSILSHNHSLKPSNKSFSRSFSSSPSDSFDRCDLHVLSSPYPPIPSGPYLPVSEFVSADWKTPSFKNKTAIIDGTTGESRTFKQYDQYTTSIAAALHSDFGVNEKSTVVLFAPNNVDYVPITLAVSLCGAKLSPVNPLYKPRELSTIMNQCRAEVLVVHSKLINVALEAMNDSPKCKHIVVISDPAQEGGQFIPEGAVGLDDLKVHDSPLTKTVNKLHNGDTSAHPFLLPFSSGTTGLPKAVCLSHENIVAQLLQYDQVEAPGFPSDHKVISPLPFFHIYGFLVSALYTAWRGQQTITMSGRFDLEDFCKLVQEHQPQRAHLVPPIILRLSKDPVVDNYNFSSMGMILSAAAPLGVDIVQDVKNRIDVDVKQAWGMSELSPFGMISSDENNKWGSVGPLAPSTFGKILDNETGKTLGPNEVGELLIKGPQAMMGYLDNPKATIECLSESGWLKTGDVAYYDDEGFFFITDRMKEMIKVRGFQVAPAELEALLLTHEHVQDVAVIGVPDEEAGEAVRAYLVLHNNDAAAKVTEEEICKWVEEQVAPYKRLKGGVVFRNEVPKSASGKILRRLLRDEVANESK